MDVSKFGWDDELGTVPPEEVTNAALRNREKYPDKRMIIHYVQPHHPWIGKTRAENLNTLWNRKEYHKIKDIETVKKAYKDNLKLVLNEVKKLIGGLDGKVIVTADHGELFGEWFLYRHPHKVHVKGLVEVPWLVIEKGTKESLKERKKIKNRIQRLKSKGKI